MDTMELAKPVRTLEDAAKAELKRKAEMIKVQRNLSADEALEHAISWQAQETGAADGFVLTPSAGTYHYRVWYRRTGANTGYDEVIVRSDTQLYHWAAVSKYLAHRIRETHDARCEYVATFAESTPDW